MNPKTPTSFWKRADRFSPILCRLLAHRGNRPLTAEEISQVSGLSFWTVETLSMSTSWAGVPVETFRAFTDGCGVDPSNARHMRRIEDYLRGRPKFAYIKKSPIWKSYYEPLMRHWLASLRGK